MKRLILAVLVLVLIGASAMLACAALQAFIKEYTYSASELDSKTSCRAIALEQVKRQLLEELGTYVESTTVVRDYAIARDEIRTISAGVVQTKLLDEKWDGRDYWLKAEVSADPEEVAASIAKVRNDTKLAEELAESQTEKEEALREVERLKAELADARTAQNKEKLEQYNVAVTQLQASDSFEQGTALAVSGDYEGAAKAYDRSIELRPNSAKAYFNRSIVYIYLGDYARATSDLDRAMVIRPANTNIYFQRASAYKEIREKRLSRQPAQPSTTFRRPFRPVPANDPLQSYLSKKQSEHKLVRVNPFQPKPRLKSTDRPVAPEARRPVIDRNRQLEATSPAHLERKGQLSPKERQTLRRKTLPPPEGPAAEEPSRPGIRKPGTIESPQAGRAKPLEKAHVEKLRKKPLRDADDEKKPHRKTDEDHETERPLRR